MTVSESDTDLIDRFLDDSLDGPEKIAFEAKRSNSDFEEYFQDQILVREMLTVKGRAIMKSSLREIEVELVKDPPIIPLYQKYRNWLLATAAAILIGVLAMAVLDRSQPSDLYYAYYTAYPNLIDPLTKGAGDKLSAYQFYEQGAYEKAITKLSALDPGQEQQWYLALSHIGSQKYASAATLLDMILSDKGHEYFDAAQWYRSLLYLKENDILKSRGGLDQILQSPNHPYKRQARLLLDEL